MDFESTITRIRILQAEQEGLKWSIQTIDDSIRNDIKALGDSCRPACLSAIATFNRSSALKILPCSVILSFDTKNRTIALSVLMHDRTGHQLHKIFKNGDLEKIEVEFRQIIEKEFSVASIPLTFTKLQVPYGYHLR